MDRLDIFPWPQWLQRSAGEWSAARSDLALWLGGTCRPIVDGVAPLLAAVGLAPIPHADAGHANLVVGGLGEPAVAERLRRHPTLLAEPLPPEGYVLTVDSAGITVGGADARGCLYGLSTMAQLLSRFGEAVRLPHLGVRDWPYKPIRGAHVYMPGRDDIPFLKRFLAWMASLKYNYLFLEVGGGMRYDRHPEVNEAWARFCEDVRAHPGGPEGLQGSQHYPKDSTHTELAGGRWLDKEEVADLVRYARSLGLEVVPELQSLSHAYYMCCAHPEIAERPYDPWPDTYCTSNPASYELYFDLVDEVLEVFQPRMLHIGHDEVYSLGVCDRCADKSGAELLAGDLNRIHDYLAERGVRTVLWGDTLMSIVIGGADHWAGRAWRAVDPRHGMDHTNRETYQAIDFVPKDMLVFDWFWAADPQSERFFESKGFEVIYGNFGQDYSPHTFYQWEKRSRRASVLGAEISTWCRANEYAYGHNLIPFRALFSANLLWWSHYTDREREMSMLEVARLQPRARLALAGETLPSLAGTASVPVPLGAAASTAPSALAGTVGGWTGAGTVSFALGERAITADAAAPVSGEVALGARVEGLAFLHYCETDRVTRSSWTFPDGMTKDDHNLLGEYVITYADGASETVEVRLGDNISRPELVFGEDQASCPFWALPAWEGRDPAGRRVTLWSHEWRNPSPQKQIASVQLRYNGARAGEAVVLLALSTLG